MSSRDYKEGFKTSGLWLVFGIVAIIVGIVLLSMATFGYGFWAKGTADFRGSVSQTNLTTANGSFRIAAYNKFFDECAQVQKDEASIRGLRAKLRHDQKGSQQESIDSTDLTAAVISRGQDISQYNADARKTQTEGAFRSSNLPYQLDPTAKETQCTA